MIRCGEGFSVYVTEPERWSKWQCKGKSVLVRLADWQPCPSSQFLESLFHVAIEAPATLPEVSELDLDFLIFAADETTGSMTIVAGPRDSFQWWLDIGKNGVSVSDSPRSSKVCFDGLSDFIACGLEIGPFDLSSTHYSFYDSVYRISHGSILTRKRGSSYFDRVSVDWISPNANNSCMSAVKTEVSDSLDSHLIGALSVGPVAVEASGGIDSGIVLSRAKKLTTYQDATFGVAASYPFQEFKLEHKYRNLISEHCGCKLLEYSESSLPFDASDCVEYHPHPALLSGSWKQTMGMTSLTQEQGGKVLLSGHGGDRLFLSPPRKTILPEQLQSRNRSSMLKASLSRDVHNARTRLREMFGQSWNASTFEPGWLCMFAGSKKNKVNRFSGLLSRRLISSMVNAWNYIDDIPRTGQKPLARWLFEDELPEQVWNRSGKIDHLGLSYRGATNNGHVLLKIFQKNREILKKSRVDIRAIMNRLRAFSLGRDVGNRELNGLLSIAFWLNSLQAEDKPQPQLFLQASKAESRNEHH